MSISISARIRPLLQEEVQNGEKTVWKIDSSKKILYYEEPEDAANSKRKCSKEIVREFTFSDVFDPEATNNGLYNKLVKDLVEMAVAGLSGSFFVYGQTGSGKTYTVSGTKYEEGVFQLAIKDILERQKQEGYKVYMSTFEIYKEQIYDLLSDDDGCREALKIKEKRDEGKFEIENLTSHHLGTWVEFKNIIYKAESRRHFAYTYLLHNSSRSHFGIQINLVPHNSKQRAGQLTFFDLAGCEKFEAYQDAVDKNLAESYSPVRMTKKERKIEGQFINKSVFFLDQVLKKLAAGNFSHIPFRSSAITKLLKNSLVGNNHTKILICVNPSESSFLTTVNSMTFALKTASYSKRRSLAHGIIGKYKDPEVEGYIQTLMKRINELESEVVGLRDQLKDREFRDLEHFTGTNEKTPRHGAWIGLTTDIGTADSKDGRGDQQADEEVSSFINMEKHSRAPHQDDIYENDCEKIGKRYSEMTQRLDALSHEKHELLSQKLKDCFKNKLLVSTPNFEVRQRDDSQEFAEGDQMLKEVLDSSIRFQGMVGLSTMPENFQSDASLSNLELVPHRFSNQFYEVSETERREVELIHQSEKGNWGRTSKPAPSNIEQPLDASYESEYENFRLILRDSLPDAPQLTLKPSKESKSLSPVLPYSEAGSNSVGNSNHSVTHAVKKSLDYQPPNYQAHQFTKKPSQQTFPLQLSGQGSHSEVKHPEPTCSSQLFNKKMAECAMDVPNQSSSSNKGDKKSNYQDASSSSSGRQKHQLVGLKEHLRTTETADSIMNSPAQANSKPSPVEETVTFAKGTHAKTNINISFEGQDACESPQLKSSSRGKDLKRVNRSEEEENPRNHPAPSQFKLPLSKLAKSNVIEPKALTTTSPLCSDRVQSRLTPVRHSMNNYQQTMKSAKRLSQVKEVETLVCFSQRESKEQSKSPGFGRISSSRGHVLQERKTNLLAKSTAGLPTTNTTSKRSPTPTASKKENKRVSTADKPVQSARGSPIPSNSTEVDKPSGPDTNRGEPKDNGIQKKKALAKKFSNISSQLRNLYTRKPLDSDCVFLDTRSKSKSQKSGF